MKRVLVTVAHGDDETNAMGATLLRLKDAGWHISILYATQPTEPVKALARRQECENAAQAFGATAIIWDEPDGSITDEGRTRQRMTDLMNQIKPDLVLGLWGIDVHPDHRVLSALALNYLMQRGRNIEYLAGELCSSGRNIDGDRPQSLGFYPTHYVVGDGYQDHVAKITRLHTSQDPEAMIVGMGRVHRNRGQECQYGNYAEAWIRLTRVGVLRNDLEQIFKPTPYVLPRSMGIDFKPETIGL